MDYKHEGHNVHLVVYHVIWCPKRRRKVLVGPVGDRLEQIIGEVAEEHGWEIIWLAIQPDHVHLFIRVNPTCQSHHPAIRHSPTHRGAQLTRLAARVRAPMQTAVAVDALSLPEHGRQRQPGDHSAVQ